MRSFAKGMSCALALACSGPAAARQLPATGADPERPEAARRIVRTFDFEERPLNPEPVPMYWFRAQHDPPARIRPGFPAWNKAAFDSSFQTSGEWSVRLPVQGGSASIRLSSGVIPAIPGADYEIACNVRTDGVEHARARVVARLLDERRREIHASEHASPFASANAEWRRIALQIRGDYPAAAWIQIDLELLQPRAQGALLPGDATAARTRDPDDPVDRERVLLEDVDGSAWFDDVVVRQIPRIALRVGGGAGVVIGPGGPDFTAQIRDLTGERLMVTIRITGLDGEEVAAVRFDAPAGEEQFVWRPALSVYGWGRATMQVVNDEGPVADTTADFVWLPPLPPPPRATASHPRPPFPEAERFAIIAEGAPAERLVFLPHAMRATGAGAAQVSAWTDDLTVASIRGSVKALDSLIERLLNGGVSVSLSLSRIPAELGRALKIDGGSSPFDALALRDAPPAPDESPSSLASTVDPRDPSRAYLSDFLSKFGQRVRRWQLGATGSSGAFWRPGLAAELSDVEARFARLVPKPIIALPWSIDHEADDRVGPGRSLTLSLPWEGPAESAAHSVERAQSGIRAHADNTIVIEPAPEGLYSPRAAAIELTKRAALAWSRAPTRLAIRSPWTLTDDGADPSPLLCVWRQVVERLGGRRVAGELPVAPGARCLILDGPQGGALLGWNDWAEPGAAVVEMFLGDGPIATIDPFGNADPVALTDRMHRVPLGETPVFIEGINVELARFRAGFTVDPPSLPAEAALHSVELVVENPWPVAISGAMRIIEPSSWKIEPRVLAFDIPAGGSQRLPVDLSFGVSEESGVKRVIAEVDVNADARFPRVRISAPIEIGLSATQLTPSYAFIPDATGAIADVSLTLSVTNNGDSSASMRVFALAPGFPRQEATISHLEPGQSAVRRFILPGGARTLMGQRLRVGLVQVGGVERLNKTIVIQ